MSTEILGKRKPHNSIYVRSVLFSSIIVCVTVVVCTTFFWRFTSQVLFSDLKDKARVVTRNLELSISPSMAISDFASVVEICQAFVVQDENVEYVVVSPREGNALKFSRDGWSMLEPDARWESAAFQAEHASMTRNPFSDGECLRYAHRITYETLQYGWVHTGYNTEGYRNNLDRLYSKTIGLGSLTLVIGAMAAMVFSLQLVRPIKRLQEFAGKIAEGDFEARIELEKHGELSDLAETMNWMSRNLKESREQLEGSFKQEASLREKEVLLREIHHRVKNNMQILGSLIRMQSRRIGDDTLKPIFKESEDRIRSMALIHEKLYQSESLSQVDLQSYFQDLTRELLRVYGRDKANISIEAEGVFLELDTAVPCGLIVNELVSNALKYAFPDGAKGEVRVSLTVDGQGEHALMVSDNGVGLPEGLDVESCDSLGLKLVNMLVDQLHGKVSLKNGVGSSFMIAFIQSRYKERV